MANAVARYRARVVAVGGVLRVMPSDTEPPEAVAAAWLAELTTDVALVAADVPPANWPAVTVEQLQAWLAASSAAPATAPEPLPQPPPRQRPEPPAGPVWVASWWSAHRAACDYGGLFARGPDDVYAPNDIVGADRGDVANAEPVGVLQQALDRFVAAPAHGDPTVCRTALWLGGDHVWLFGTDASHAVVARYLRLNIGFLVSNLPGGRP